MGNFATLQDIPEMYRQCRETEDKDMGPFDFVTDHLINIDSIFDKHDNGDKQKPHKHKQIEHQAQVVTFFKTSFAPTIELTKPIRVNLITTYCNFIPSDFIFKIFQPPIN